jgi:sulfide:quinone oxidoreductase
MAQHPTRVLIAGGGVAAVELMLALHHLAEERVELELLAPGRDFTYRPLAVAEPFKLGETRRFDLSKVAAEHGVRHRADTLASVDPERRHARTGRGDEIRYDALAVAVGARPREALPGALTFAREGDAGVFRDLLEEIGGEGVTNVVFAVPSGVVWSLPLYELALMTATLLQRRDVSDVKLTFVTPEESVLGVFGGRASRAVQALLEERGIEIHTGAYPVRIENGTLTVAADDPLPADRVVTLPRLDGPRLPGLPHDSRGFIPTDPHGRVEGVDDVYAAGDATTFPVKQGGLATQQADAIAEAIAARAGASVTPEPFRPVLRGLLLTGSTPTYLSTELRGGLGDTSRAEVEPLWWPPSKIAGRYLSHYLARLTAAAEPAPGVGIRIEIDDLEQMIRWPRP